MENMSPEQLAEIERAIETFNAMDPAERDQLLQRHVKEWEVRIAPLLKSIEETEQRGPDDWKIRVRAA